MRSPLKSVAVLFNPKLPAARELSLALRKLMAGRGIEVSVCEFRREDESISCLAQPTDLIVTLGGDGTLLHTAHFAAVPGIPVLGVNLGKLGFLCDLGPDHVLEEIPPYLDGKCQVEERLMLQVTHLRDGVEVSCSHALNDAVVGHASVSSIVRIQASVNGNHLTTFAADGVIVATPSGSTAYSFAAGGPIVHPADEHILLTPISPHKPRFGSFVAPPHAVIRLDVEGSSQAVLSVDGQPEMPVQDGDIVEVRESPYKTRLLRRDSERYFFQALRATLKYGLEP
ncbi:MAG: NAD(+)/NADH kinase [Chloroflexota bacterium]|nr:NAD(+)/NADH kinase [Chloroflexota bacterium]